MKKHFMILLFKDIIVSNDKENVIEKLLLQEKTLVYFIDFNILSRNKIVFNIVYSYDRHVIDNQYIGRIKHNN